MKTYICPNCDSESRFKGLCRDCTTYDDDGNVVNAVRREELGKHVHDENCGHHHHRQTPTIEQFRAARRPKLTKKQMQRYYDILKEAEFTEGTVEEAKQVLLAGINNEEE